MTFDTLKAVENQLADRKAKLASRSRRKEYRDSIHLLEAEIIRLENTRSMILEARESGNNDG